MTAPAENAARLRTFCLDLGFSLYGAADVADIRDGFLLADRLKARFPRAVSLGKGLVDDVLDDIEDKPTPLYFHHYRQINYFLDRGALLVAAHIKELGFAALPIAASQIVDWPLQRAHLSHKHVALRAGLGWIGRNNLLVNKELGSRFRLVTVLTDMPLDTDSPVAFGCGTCRACVAPCPAGAIKERPEDFDHRACYAKLDEWRKTHVVSQHICGVCVKACRGPISWKTKP